jgi:hypothetical protein
VEYICFPDAGEVGLTGTSLMTGVVWAIPKAAVASSSPATNATWIRFGIIPSFPEFNAPLLRERLYVMAGTTMTS